MDYVCGIVYGPRIKGEATILGFDDHDEISLPIYKIRDSTPQKTLIDKLAEEGVQIKHAKYLCNSTMDDDYFVWHKADHKDGKGFWIPKSKVLLTVRIEDFECIPKQVRAYLKL